MKQCKIKRAKGVLPINYLEWGFVGSSTWSAIVGKIDMGKK